MTTQRWVENFPNWLEISPNRVLVLKTCQKVIHFGMFSGRVRGMIPVRGGVQTSKWWFLDRFDVFISLSWYSDRSGMVLECPDNDFMSIGCPFFFGPKKTALSRPETWLFKEAGPRELNKASKRYANLRQWSVIFYIIDFICITFTLLKK